MSDEVFERAKDIRPTYSGFLIRRIEGIWEAWDEGNVEVALRRALRLVNFLPKKYKRKMEDQARKIIIALNDAYKTQGVDWYTRQQNRNRKARQVAILFLEPFVDQITDWLDEGGYFEVGARIPTRKTSIKDMGKQLDRRLKRAK